MLNTNKNSLVFVVGFPWDYYLQSCLKIASSISSATCNRLLILVSPVLSCIQTCQSHTPTYCNHYSPRFVDSFTSLCSSHIYACIRQCTLLKHAKYNHRTCDEMTFGRTTRMNMTLWRAGAQTQHQQKPRTSRTKISRLLAWMRARRKNAIETNATHTEHAPHASSPRRTFRGNVYKAISCYLSLSFLLSFQAYSASHTIYQFTAKDVPTYYSAIAKKIKTCVF